MSYIKAKCKIGSVINGFKVLDSKRENKRTFLFVECPYCHSKVWMRADSVSSGKTVSCGCYNIQHNQKKPKDISNMQFGRLTAIAPTNNRDHYNKSVIWECICKCGNTAYVSEAALVKHSVRSCGCLQSETFSENGKNNSKYVKDTYCLDGTNVTMLKIKNPKNNTSGYKGVCWDKARNKWVAQIVFKGHHYNLGRYFAIEDAITARKIAEDKMHGEFLDWYYSEHPEKLKGDIKNENRK